ncbi:methylmalonyl-CoA epimerase [Aureimonas jatrophae]|uniref:Methylmalonyl-CoA epimerase n=1 Tax=Aureimonas jatrophae TaxID=1166073 RepID=A0A1H0FM83_9HYPH|nr:methylmalonyl-CoA epimerase [Aureimonas jatrophae]MBB3949951.1 methylmalonyl-CoA/ethylmalonyl-CoA epimerase [Aureimonas jatrophae]SDN95714.1 methylmalonyl-CoA epimerase [Aureimonas jatrophae]
MFERLNHVGVATPSVARAREHYARLFGPSAVGASFDLPAQGVRVCFVDAPNTQIELIEPLGDASPIAAFLDRNPAGGQHHLCFEVADLDAAIRDAASMGARPLGEPRLGAHGTRVVFLHPREMGGVLVELMEASRAGH